MTNTCNYLLKQHNGLGLCNGDAVCLLEIHVHLPLSLTCKHMNSSKLLPGSPVLIAKMAAWGAVTVWALCRGDNLLPLSKIEPRYCLSRPPSSHCTGYTILGSFTMSYWPYYSLSFILL